MKEREIGRSNQIYTFHIDKSDDSDNYTYSYWGEVVRFDAEKNIIYLSDEGKNKEYAFLVAGDKENTMAQVSNYLGLRWEDERTLRQILQDGKKLDLPLNIDSPIIFPPKR